VVVLIPPLPHSSENNINRRVLNMAVGGTQFIYTDAQKKNTHIKKKTDDEDNRRIYKQIMYTDMQSSTKYYQKLHDDDDRPIL